MKRVRQEILPGNREIKRANLDPEISLIIYTLSTPFDRPHKPLSMSHRHQDLPVVLHNEKRGLLTVEEGRLDVLQLSKEGRRMSL